MHTSPPLCWENSRDTCVESRGKKRRTVKFHGGGGNTVGLSLMFENLSFNIVRAGENTGGKTTLEAACTREVKLNGRRRELPGNWKLGCERRTGRLCHPDTREAANYETEGPRKVEVRVRTLIRGISRDEGGIFDRSFAATPSIHPPLSLPFSSFFIFHPPLDSRYLSRDFACAPSFGCSSFYRFFGY